MSEESSENEKVKKISGRKLTAIRRMEKDPDVFKKIGLKGGMKSTGYKVLSRPVRQYTMGGRKVKDFPSIHRAAASTGVPVPSIHANLKGRMVHAGGFRWEYLPK